MANTLKTTTKNIDMNVLIIGNITFHHFDEQELELFSTGKERKALVHDIECIVQCSSEHEAECLGEEALGKCCESYLIPCVFEVNGEVVYECSNSLLPITVENFRVGYLD
jgi:hypothetical protein